MKEQKIKFTPIPSTAEVKAERDRLAYRRRYLRVLRSTVYALLVVAAIAVLLATLFLPVLQVSGDSMNPTLQDKDIILLGLANSKMIDAGKQLGLRVANEVFADRAYQADGSLVPRKLPGAVIHDKDEAIARTVRMVTEGKVTAITGEEVEIAAHSICVHGDNPSAVEFVKNIRTQLTARGVEIAPIREIV